MIFRKLAYDPFVSSTWTVSPVTSPGDLYRQKPMLMMLLLNVTWDEISPVTPVLHLRSPQKTPSLHHFSHRYFGPPTAQQPRQQQNSPPEWWLENSIPGISKDLNSLKLTVRTWKWMVGRLVSYWGSLFSGANLLLVSGSRVNFFSKNPMVFSHDLKTWK